MSTQTHIFKLPSGPECEVTELTGKHQELLTIQSSKSHTERLTELLADCIVRVGSERNITPEFVNAMLSGDKKKALVEIRQFTLGFQNSFSFTYEYLDSEKKKKTHEVVVDLDEKGEFPFRTMKIEKEVQKEDGTTTVELVDANFTEYDEVLAHKKVSLVLPRSGQEIQFTMLDGKGELIGSKTSKKDRSSHTLLKMRQPVYFHKKENGKDTVPIQFDLNRAAYMDLEALRKKIKEVEPDVDTEVMFEHPEEGYKDEVVDILSVVAFFFPSEAL